MEEAELEDARDDMVTLERDYKHLENGK